MSKYKTNEYGFYGNFGGAYIPEMLYPNIENLKQNYKAIINTDSFQNEFKDLLKNYVGRPSPLYFAKNLSKKYNTNIYLKREDLNHTGSHKINNTIGQILLAKQMGKTRIIAETGAGQHGVATATVATLLGIDCVIYMGEKDMQRQAPNVERIKMLGAKVIAAKSGSKTLKDATNEALRDWINNPENTFYVIGSVVGPHPYPEMVAEFQSIISKEIKIQLFEKTGKENPDYVIACVGGGSNAIGTFYNFLEDDNVKLIATEAGGLGIETGKTAASLKVGKPGVIHGSKTYLIQTDDGQIIEPHSISAGLDYPGIGPLHAHLHDIKRVNYISINDDEALKAGFMLTRTEGILPALESAHAVAVLEKQSFKTKDVIVVTISGRGDKDLSNYLQNNKFKK